MGVFAARPHGHDRWGGCPWWVPTRVIQVPRQYLGPQNFEGSMIPSRNDDVMADEAALAVIIAEVGKPRLIEELHAAHARWGAHAQLYWLLDMI